MIHETVRRMINTLATDLTVQSAANITATHPASLREVQAAPPLIGFSKKIRQEQQDLKKFLRDHLYQHYQVARMSNKARHTVERLFQAFSADARLLPPEYQEKYRRNGHRAIADYIAGMTDRYAIREYGKLFAIEEA